jgi:hypothetical protein
MITILDRRDDRGVAVMGHPHKERDTDPGAEQNAGADDGRI